MKLKRVLYLIIIFIGLIFPVFQMSTKLLPEVTLNGVVKSTESPKFSQHNWLNGSFQSDFDKWFRENFGLRNYFIRVSNQIHYSVFNESTNESIIMGKDKQLFERWYIIEKRKLFPFFPLEKQELEKKVAEIKELQDLLAKRGIPLLVVITPNKATVYPENIPDEFKENTDYQLNDYDNFVPFLDKYNINYLDTYKIIMDEKAKSQYPLFPQGGTHWNYLGSYYASKEIINKMETLMNKDLVNIDCSNITVDNNPVGTDKDLANLLNLVKGPYSFMTPHPQITNNSKGTEFKPNVFLEGGSFAGQIIDTLENNKVFNNLDYYFYYKTKTVFPEKKATDIDRSNVDWNKEVFSNDIVILEINQFVLHEQIGSGFIQDAIKNLK